MSKDGNNTFHEKYYQDLQENIPNELLIVIEKKIEDSIEKAFEKHKDHCPVRREDTDHLFGMISDLGDGDTSKGIEKIREQNKYFAKIRKINDAIAAWIAMTIIVTIVTLIMSALIYGIVTKIRGN